MEILKVIVDAIYRQHTSMKLTSGLAGRNSIYTDDKVPGERRYKQTAAIAELNETVKFRRSLYRANGVKNRERTQVRETLGWGGISFQSRHRNFVSRMSKYEERGREMRGAYSNSL